MLRYWQVFALLLKYCLHLPWWKIRFKHFRSRFSIHKGVIITHPGRASIGNHATIYHGCFIAAGLEGEVSLGDYSHIGVDAYLNASEGRIKIGNLHAAIGLSQFARLEEFMPDRRQVAQIYDEELEKINGATSVRIASGVKSKSYKYVVLSSDGIERVHLNKEMKERYSVGLSGEGIRRTLLTLYKVG